MDNRDEKPPQSELILCGSPFEFTASSEPANFVIEQSECSTIATAVDADGVTTTLVPAAPGWLLQSAPGRVV